MKFQKVFWGLALVLCAVFIILDATDVIAPFTSVFGDVSVFFVILGIMLLALAVERIANGKFNEIFVPIALIFMLFEKNIAFAMGLEKTNIINNWIVLLCAVLLTVGVGMLMPKNIKRLKKGKRSRYIGSSSSYIDCADFSSREVENNMGSCVVRFENTDEYSGNGVLTIENNMGSLAIYVPNTWNVRTNIENNMGSVRVDGDGDTNGPLLIINGENNMGSVLIEYV